MINAIIPSNLARGNKKNENGVTEQQEEFARLVAETGTLTEAYIRVYFISAGKEVKGKPETIHTRAYMLSQKPNVAKRIEHYTQLYIDKKNKELEDRLKASQGKDRTEELSNDRIRSFIREGLFDIAKCEDERSSDRLKAMELLGKLAGVSAFEKIADNPTDVEETKAKQRLKELVEGLKRQGKLAILPDKPAILLEAKPLESKDKS